MHFLSNAKSAQTRRSLIARLDRIHRKSTEMVSGRPGGSTSKASARGRSQARHHRGAGRDKTIFTDSSRDYGKPASAINDASEDELVDSACEAAYFSSHRILTTFADLDKGKGRSLPQQQARLPVTMWVGICGFSDLRSLD